MQDNGLFPPFPLTASHIYTLTPICSLPSPLFSPILIFALFSRTLALSYFSLLVSHGAPHLYSLSSILSPICTLLSLFSYFPHLPLLYTLSPLSSLHYFLALSIFPYIASHIYIHYLLSPLSSLLSPICTLLSPSHASFHSALLSSSLLLTSVSPPPLLSALSSHSLLLSLLHNRISYIISLISPLCYMHFSHYLSYFLYHISLLLSVNISLTNSHTYLS